MIIAFICIVLIFNTMETISIHRPKIVVIGSCNTDMVVKANRLPVPGETILGGTFYMNPGGKGANQAIAAARLGAEVTFISKIGYDLFGLQALEIYRSEKINTEYIFTDQKSPSGVALISVDSFGENSIIVAPGASRSLSIEDINKAEEKVKEADIILMQLEIPIDTVEYAATIACKYGKKVILNPAPASSLSNSFLKNVHTILPHQPSQVNQHPRLSGATKTATQPTTSARKQARPNRRRSITCSVGRTPLNPRSWNTIFQQARFTALRRIWA